MRHKNLWTVVLLILASLLLAACAPESDGADKIEPSKLEEIAGSEFKRVVLTEKAAERLGIETATVSEEQVSRMRKVGGRVVTPADLAAIPATGVESSTAADISTVWVQVQLSESDLSKVDRNQPARVLPIGDDEDDTALTAEPDKAPAADDAEDTDEDDRALYYVVDNADQQLQPAQRVFVELALAGVAQQRLVVPYAAVVYGLEGETWVYTNPEPLVYVRQPIVVDYIEGDMAVLTEGPATGTPVVVTGVAELFGAETGVSK